MGELGELRSPMKEAHDVVDTTSDEKSAAAVPTVFLEIEKDMRTQV